MGMVGDGEVFGLLTYTVAFFISALVAFLLTPMVRWLAHRLKLVDEPSEARKIHDKAVPRVGGIAIAVAFFVPVLGLYFIDNDVSQAYLTNSNKVMGLILGSLAMIGLGLWDDVRGLGPKTKFIIQVLVAIGVFYLDYRIETLANPFGKGFELGYFALPFTVLWIVGIVNAINLIDGLDGLAGGVSLITVLTLFVVAILLDKLIVALTAIALAGALIGFLRYNFNPATIFMGDSGSLFLGFVLAITAISGASKSSTVVSLAIPVLALGLPILDTGMSVFRRFVGGKPVFGADRGHIHHKLLDLGLSQKQVVVALYGFCILSGTGALGMVYADSGQAAVVLLAMGMIVIVFSKVLGYLSWQTVTHSLQYGLRRQQRLRVHLKYLEEAAQAVGSAKDVDEMYTVLRAVADEVGLDLLQLDAQVEHGSVSYEYELFWSREEGEEQLTKTAHQIGHPLRWKIGDVAITGRICFTWYCKEEILQVPERVCYELISTKTRDRLLHLAFSNQTPSVSPLASSGS